MAATSIGMANHVGDGATSSTAARIETRSATYWGSEIPSLRAIADNSPQAELATRTVQAGEVSASESGASVRTMECYLTSVDGKASSIDVPAHVRGERRGASQYRSG